MGVILLKINDDLEVRFRKAAYKLFGAKKGALSKAIEEAIKNWLGQVETEEESNVSWDELKVRSKKPIEKLLEESKELDEKKIAAILRNLGLEEA